MLTMTHREFAEAFRAESKRQERFTNSFWRQLIVILISLAIIQWVGPKIIFYGTNIGTNLTQH